MDALILLSAVCNVFLAGGVVFLLKRKPKTPERQLDKSATELLQELMEGGAVVVTSVVDPASVFQWSPKAKR
jgi:hypothetical protein